MCHAISLANQKCSCCTCTYATACGVASLTLLAEFVLTHFILVLLAFRKASNPKLNDKGRKKKNADHDDDDVYSFFYINVYVPMYINFVIRGHGQQKNVIRIPEWMFIQCGEGRHASLSLLYTYVYNKMLYKQEDCLLDLASSGMAWNGMVRCT